MYENGYEEEFDAIESVACTRSEPYLCLTQGFWVKSVRVTMRNLLRRNYRGFFDKQPTVAGMPKACGK